MTEDPVQPNPKRVILSAEDIRNIPREELIQKWKDQEAFISHLENQKSKSASTSDTVAENGANPPEFDDKLKQQQLEAARRENILVMRLTSKEQEVQDLLSQISELKQVQLTNSAQLRSKLLDPAVNLMFQRMKKEMEQAKEKMEQTQNELSAWKFTADSQTGKRLMSRCRMLLQENEELAKNISSGRTAKLESDIALERKLIEEMKTAQQETDEFLGELDEDVEGMQSTIYLLQQQLKEAKEQISRYEQQLTQNGLQPAEGSSSSAELQRTSHIGAVDDEAEIGCEIEETNQTETTETDAVMETDNRTEGNGYEPAADNCVADQRTHYIEDTDTWSPDPYKESSEKPDKEKTSESASMETDAVENGIGSPTY